MDLQDTERLQSDGVLGERELVELAIKGDRAAFTALYDLHVSQVYRHVHYRVYSPAEAEDITQETFIKAWKAIERFRITGAPFVAWLLTIAHNLILDYYKAVRRAALLWEAAQEEFLTSAGQSPEASILDNVPMSLAQKNSTEVLITSTTTGCG